MNRKYFLICLSLLIFIPLLNPGKVLALASDCIMGIDAYSALYKDYNNSTAQITLTGSTLTQSEPFPVIVNNLTNQTITAETDFTTHNCNRVDTNFYISKADHSGGWVEQVQTTITNYVGSWGSGSPSFNFTPSGANEYQIYSYLYARYTGDGTYWTEHRYLQFYTMYVNQHQISPNGTLTAKMTIPFYTSFISNPTPNSYSPPNYYLLLNTSPGILANQTVDSREIAIPTANVTFSDFTADYTVATNISFPISTSLNPGTTYYWRLRQTGSSNAPSSGASGSSKVTAYIPGPTTGFTYNPPNQSPTPTTAPPGSSTTPGICSTSNDPSARASGLVSTSNLLGKFNTASGACIIDPKATFFSYKIPSYEKIKSLYYTQGKNSSTTTKHPATSTATSINLGGTTNHTYLFTDNDVNISSPSIITGNNTGIIFIDKNLNIGPLPSNKLQGNNNSGIVFIVGGDVIIDPSVTQIDATIISGGTIFTAGGNCSNNNPIVNSLPLVINGSLISLNPNKPIKFCRSLTSNLNPSETINQQAKYLVLLKDLFADSIQKWSEVSGSK